MKQKTKKRLPLMIGAAMLLGAEVGLEMLFGQQQFLPLFLMSQIMLLLGGSSVILGVFGWIHLRYPEWISAFAEKMVSETPDPEEMTLEETVPAGEKKRKKVRRKRTDVFRKCWRGLIELVGRKAAWVALLSLAVLFAMTLYRFYLAFRYYYIATVQIGYLAVTLLLILMFVCIVLDKWCFWAQKNLSEEDRLEVAILHDLRIAFKFTKVCALFCAGVIVLRLIGIWDAQRVLSYVLVAIGLYCCVFYLISVLSRMIRGELVTYPRLAIPLPFTGKNEDDDMHILTHLETNTGITFRSLWSLHYIQKALPYTVFGAVLVFWLATGLVQVGANETGVRYRFGKLDESGLLEPGLHLTLPWPFDKTEIYDTGSVREMVIGYDSDRTQDNLWTEEHGNNEYRLLLGEGNELVSVNLRIKYVIDDMWEYVTVSADPAKILSAEAYELITNRIISTDLNELLSQDRSALSDELHASLNAELEHEAIGLSVVQVIVENIHPPVDVADVYQQMVSAEIQAEQMMLEAESIATVKLFNAQTSYELAVQEAWEKYYTKVAEAKAEVTEFMAAAAADNSYSEAYRYYQYLNALMEALQDSKLYLLGTDIDAESLFFGDNYIIVNGSGGSN